MMEESERLLDDVELFLNSKSFVDESIPRKKEDVKYRDALEKVKRGEYVEATKILTKLLKEKRRSDNRNDLWNLGTRLDLRAVCYERRGLIRDTLEFDNVKNMEHYKGLMGELRSLNYLEEEVKNLLDKKEQEEE